MESSSLVVIKVKYGDMLRRFDALIADDELILTMDLLKWKILSLFPLTSDTELILTYVDEDGDVVNLVDNDDIRDVLRQGLNPLRITVAVKSEKLKTHSSASSSHMSSPCREKLMQYLQTGVSELLGTLPRPVRDALLKLYANSVSKASPTPDTSELLGSFAEMCMHCLDLFLESHNRNDMERSRVDPAPTLGVPSDEAPDIRSENIESPEKVEPQAVNRSNEVKIPTVAGGSVAGVMSFDSTAVAAALDSLNTHAISPSSDPLPHPLPLPCYNSPGPNKDKVKKTIGTTPLSPAAVKTGMIIRSGKPELYNGPTKSCLQQMPRLPMDPFSETELGNAAYVPPCSQKIVHNGIGCDGCDIQPIRGPRFKSKVKEDYDLCSTCFEKMGNHKDYVRMDFPAVYGLQYGVFCDGCHIQPIRGPRFKSKVKDYDLCSTCFDKMGNDKDYIRMDFPAFYGLHNGVCCDGCNIEPIRGARFNSKVKEDYDLCSTCFGKMGNDNDYVRMDVPAVYGLPCRDITCHTQDRGSTLPHAYSDSLIKLNSVFIKDVNILDGTVMAPSTPFTKIWRMRNNGTSDWLQGTQLVWIGGDKMSNMPSVELKIAEGGVWMGQELDIMVDFISPDHPGRYVSYWRMATPTGKKFGQRVWVLIQVNASTKETQHENIRNLNLNLPPESGGLACSEVFKVDPALMVAGSNLEPDLSRKWMDPITEQDLVFPINDNFSKKNQVGNLFGEHNDKGLKTKRSGSMIVTKRPQANGFK